MLFRSRWATNNAIGSPIFFEKPLYPRMKTFDHGWNEPHKAFNPYWPYVPVSWCFLPDFTNRVNKAEEYAKPFSLPVMEKYLTLAADEMETGLESYRAAALRAPAAKRVLAFKEVLIAEQIERMLRSARATLEFEDLRFHLVKTDGLSERRAILDRMAAILIDEIASTQASMETARRDSRLGYEWEQDYMYRPDILEDKLRLLRVALGEQIPAYRISHGIR